MSLMQNAIKTPDGTILISNGEYDYKTHKDANGKTYMVDGGTESARTIGHQDQVYLMVRTSDSPYLKRQLLVWRDNEERYIFLKDMSTDLIVDTLQLRMSPARRQALMDELELRASW